MKLKYSLWNCHIKFDTLLSHIFQTFILCRCFIAQGWMSPDSVVIGFDIFKDLLPGLIFGEKCVLIDQFGLDGFEKRLGHGIIPAVTLTVHTLYEAVSCNHFPELSQAY